MLGRSHATQPCTIAVSQLLWGARTPGTNTVERRLINSVVAAPRPLLATPGPTSPHQSCPQPLPAAMSSTTLAIWIDNPRVDSMATLPAYLSVTRPGDAWYGRLTVQVHRAPRGCVPTWPPSVRPTACTAPSRFRCEVRQGGYAFRWFHDAWAAPYVRMRRIRLLAWSPDETPEMSASFDAEFQARQPAHQMEMRAQMRDLATQVAAAGLIMNLARQTTSDDAS